MGDSVQFFFLGTGKEVVCNDGDIEQYLSSNCITEKPFIPDFEVPGLGGTPLFFVADVAGTTLQVAKGRVPRKESDSIKVLNRPIFFLRALSDQSSMARWRKEIVSTCEALENDWRKVNQSLSGETKAGESRKILDTSFELRQRVFDAVKKFIGYYQDSKSAVSDSCDDGSSEKESDSVRFDSLEDDYNLDEEEEEEEENDDNEEEEEQEEQPVSSSRGKMNSRKSSGASFDRSAGSSHSSSMSPPRDSRSGFSGNRYSQYGSSSGLDHSSGRRAQEPVSFDRTDDRALRDRVKESETVSNSLSDDPFGGFSGPKREKGTKAAPKEQVSGGLSDYPKPANAEMEKELERLKDLCKVQQQALAAIKQSAAFEIAELRVKNQTLTTMLRSLVEEFKLDIKLDF